MGKTETLSDLRKSKNKQKSLSLHFKPSIKQEKKNKTLNSEKVSNLPEAILMGTAKGQEPTFLACVTALSILQPHPWGRSALCELQQTALLNSP